ncbi:unnamed protein product [Staurois parvus]|uniref:Secreted protein n=2 Tax=Staurois parvus TaxID=386267 RepID=A0ABN9FL69_9NEOB|nr:unnamed protein product [Staurois parvus]
MRRCSTIPVSLTLSCAPTMSLLQCPRQCNPADAGICHLGSVPCERRDVRGTERREIHKNDNKSNIH